MDYSKKVFGKSINDLTYQIVEDYFNEEREESNSIEFKSYSAQHGNLNKNLDGVIRGICAFLNSDGGIVIWGAPEGIKVEGREEKLFVGQLSPVLERKEKDWLINKVSDLLTPMPIGVNVSILENANTFVYIFEIQKSSYSPHQFKHVYYARLDGQTKPAPHYLIDALFKKITYPSIEGYVNLIKLSHDGTNYLLDIQIYIFNFSELLNCEDVAFRLMSVEGKFLNSNNPDALVIYNYDGHNLVHKDLIKVLHYGSPNFHSERIVYNPRLLSEKYGNKAIFYLSFGAKNSPLKASAYELDFSKIDWKNVDHPNYLFSKIEENKLYAEVQNEKNISKKETLKEVLKR